MKLYLPVCQHEKDVSFSCEARTTAKRAFQFMPLTCKQKDKTSCRAETMMGLIYQGSDWEVQSLTNGLYTGAALDKDQWIYFFVVFLPGQIFITKKTVLNEHRRLSCQLANIGHGGCNPIHL